MFDWQTYEELSVLEDVLDAALARGETLDQVNEHGSTPLHVAAREDKEGALVGRLLAAGAPVNAVDGSSKTPLHVATIKAGPVSLKVLEKLLQGGADVEKTDSLRQTALHCAAFHCRGGMVRRLLAAGAVVNAASFDGKRPLHMAANGEWAEETLKALLEAGATVDQPDDRGMTPLFVAVRQGFEANARLLLQAGAAPGAMAHSVISGGNTPLLVAEQRDALYQTEESAALLAMLRDPQVVRVAGGDGVLV